MGARGNERVGRGMSVSRTLEDSWQVEKGKGRNGGTFNSQLNTNAQGDSALS